MHRVIDAKSGIYTSTRAIDIHLDIPVTIGTVQEKQLRRLSGRSVVRRIARELRRTEAAVRYKAHTLGVSLALKRG